MTLRAALAAHALLLVVAFPSLARASGHGPVYGLATPTLAQDGWSLDVAAMARFDRPAGALEARQTMLRGMLGYGLGEDLQLSVSVPVSIREPEAGPSATRMMAMMPAQPDVEAILSWRFHRVGNAVGSRIESTALFGVDVPTDSTRAGLRTSPALLAGVVTGYASRSVYAWVGALYRWPTEASDAAANRPGDLLLYSLVVGYRPRVFRRELPHSDWRIFLEVVGESTLDKGIDTGAVTAGGGHQVFVGPTLLGLYGAWGVSGGPLFRVASDPQRESGSDDVRFVVNFTRWF